MNRSKINSINAKKGTSAQDEFEGRIKHRYGKAAFIHRVTDTAEVRGMTKNKKVFTKQQPSDFIVTIAGDMFYAEVKTTNKERFSFSAIGVGQWQAATQQVTAGGKYFFYVRSELLEKWFKVPASFVLGLDADGKKSFTWDDVKHMEWSL